MVACVDEARSNNTVPASVDSARAPATLRHPTTLSTKINQLNRARTRALTLTSTVARQVPALTSAAGHWPGYDSDGRRSALHERWFGILLYYCPIQI